MLQMLFLLLQIWSESATKRRQPDLELWIYELWGDICWAVAALLHCCLMLLFLLLQHRISTILHSDRILVLDAGCLAEFNSPKVLLSNPKSIFYSLVHNK